jgi:uncharacterized protein YndB with AHSA1/START domain
MPSRVEILYCDDCPHYAGVVRQVRDLLEREGIRVDVDLWRVTDDDDARAARFLGSPTVRVDGRDVEPGAERRDDFGIKCRLYPTVEGVQPVPPEEWIVNAVRQDRDEHVLVCRHQTLIGAPARQLWDLLGDPRRHPEWWPRVTEVQGQQFGEGCTYCQVSRDEQGAREQTFLVERLEDCREISIRCDETGLYMRWVLTEAQGGTFVDAEFGLDRAGAPRGFDPEQSKQDLRRWLYDSLDALKRASPAA